MNTRIYSPEEKQFIASQIRRGVTDPLVFFEEHNQKFNTSRTFGSLSHMISQLDTTDLFRDIPQTSVEVLQQGLRAEAEERQPGEVGASIPLDQNGNWVTVDDAARQLNVDDNVIYRMFQHKHPLRKKIDKASGRILVSTRAVSERLKGRHVQERTTKTTTTRTATPRVTRQVATPPVRTSQTFAPSVRETVDLVRTTVSNIRELLGDKEAETFINKFFGSL